MSSLNHTRRLIAVGAALIVFAIIVIPLLPLDSGGTRAAARGRGETPARVDVTIAPRGRPGPIPVARSFLGISAEYWSVPLYVRHLRVFGRLMALLHVPGDGPLVFRVGGDSADHTFWRPPWRRGPGWMFALTPRWLSGTRALALRTHLRLIVDLNLVTDSPFAAAEWARAAYAGLPRGSITGFEIGNEPDIYSRYYWLAVVARSGFDARVLPLRLSAAQYATDFRLYAQGIRRIAPGVPLLGPALANPLRDAGWLATLLRDARPAVGVVTVHRYPFSACVKPRSPVYPTIARILSERASTGMASAVSRVVGLAQRAQLPVRLTEMNSVTCGGRTGVSNAFATALWAPDALFELMRSGVDGVNVHVRSDAINAAFVFGKRGLEVRPLLYGLVLFARTLGPDAQLVPLRVHTTNAVRVKAWGVQTRNGFHVLLIDKGRRGANVSIGIPGGGPANVQRLTAPSASASAGVTLAGQTLGRDGRWHGPRDRQVLSQAAGGYHVTVAGFSAALVTIPLPGDRTFVQNAQVATPISRSSG